MQKKAGVLIGAVLILVVLTALVFRFGLTNIFLHNSCDVEDERGIESKQGILTNNAERGRTECVRNLLKRGANPNEGRETGYTPLLAASQFGHLEEVQLLINAGADVNFDGRGTPLCRALQNKAAQMNLVSVLVDSGAKLTWGSESTALNCLGDNEGRSDKFNFLVSKGIVDQMTQRQKDVALSFLNWDEARFLISHGADPNSVDDSGKTPLIRATINKQCEMVKFLLEHGANAALRGPDDKSALDWATAAGSELDSVKGRADNFPQLPQAIVHNHAIIYMLRVPKSAQAVSCD